MKNSNTLVHNVPSLSVILAAFRKVVATVTSSTRYTKQPLDGEVRRVRIEAYTPDFLPVGEKVRGLSAEVRERLTAGASWERRQDALHLGYLACWDTFGTELDAKSVFHVLVVHNRLQLAAHEDRSSGARSLTVHLDELAESTIEALLLDLVGRPYSGSAEVVISALPTFLDSVPVDVLCRAVSRFLPGTHVHGRTDYNKAGEGSPFTVRVGERYVVGSMSGSHKHREVRIGDEVLLYVSLDSEVPYGPWSVDRDVLERTLALLDLPAVAEDEDIQRRWCLAPVLSTPVVLDTGIEFASAN